MGNRASHFRNSRWRNACLLVVLVWVSAVLPAHAQHLRIVNYNIEADTDGNTAPNSGLSTVLEAIGTQSVNGIVQPIDILALEETTSNTQTVAPIVAALNAYYGAGTYAMANYQGTEYNNDPTTGDGPNALIYNTKTVALIAAGGVTGTPGKSGNNTIYRQVVRYQFQAVGAASTTYFYAYVSHMKSGSASTTSNANDRTAEAQIIRADEVTLPAGTSALYMGDFNLGGSTETAYQTLTASGTGQGIDVLNLALNYAENWNASAYAYLVTESDTKIEYRDDIQFMTADIYNGTASAALRYVAGSYRAFGNNGTTAFEGSVNQASNTALNNLTGTITASQAFSDLVTASDHLPLIVDYTVATPYNTWRLQHFTAAQLANPAVSGDLADPDGDGIPNLLEYALNLDPNAASAAGLPTAGQTTVGGSQYLTLTYTRVIAATGITYQPQVSGDLSTWNGGPGYTAPVSTTNNPDGMTQTVVAQDAVAMTAGGRRFMRLQVSRP